MLKSERLSVLGVSIAAFLLSFFTPVHGASQRDLEKCEQPKDLFGRIASCTRVIEDTRETPSNREMAFGKRGASYLAAFDNDRAIEDFNQAIKIEPGNAVTHNNRGNAYKNKGDLDQAMINYTEVIRLNPKLARAYSFRGNVYRDRGEFDRAIADYNEAIRQNPKDAFTYNIRGTAYRAKGDAVQAMADYSEFIRLESAV